MRKYEHQTIRLGKISDFFVASNSLRLNNYFRLFSVLSLMLISVLAIGEEMVFLDFSKGVIPERAKVHRTWKNQDGRLRTPTGSNMTKLEIEGKDWYHYEISYTLSLIALHSNKNDGHFGLNFKSGDTAAMLYTRENWARLNVAVSAEKTKHYLISDKFEKLQVGSDAIPVRYRILVDDGRLTLFINDNEVGSCDKLPPSSDGISFYTYNWELAIDNIEIKVFKTQPHNATVKSPNLALNSSFEETTLDELPDYWGVMPWGMTSSYWILEHSLWQKYFRSDKTDAWHGKRAMRIENPKEGRADQELTLTSYTFGMKMGTTYTLSAYMKSSSPGMKIKMGSWNQQRELVLSDKWERYSHTWTRGSLSLLDDMLQFVPMSKGVAWIDAVQLEVGNAVSAYYPATGERGLITHEGNAEKQLFDVVEMKPPLFSATKLTLDGKLDEKVWESIPSVKFRTTAGQAVKEDTVLQVFYTTEGLYLGITAQEKGTDKIVCGKTKDGEFVWTDSSIEIFIDSKLSRGVYYHLAFNIDGKRYSRGESMLWDGNWQVATKRGNDFWTAEVFIPFSDLQIDHANGLVWGFNVGRNNRSMRETSCWAPTYGGFHSPLRFGRMEIAESVQKKYLVGVNNTSLCQIDGSTGELTVGITDRTEACQPLEFRGILHGGNFPIQFSTTFEQGKSISSFSVPQFSGNGKYTLQSEILRKGEVIHRSIHGISIVSVFNLKADRNYYTSEKELRLRFVVNLSPAQLKNSEIKLSFSRNDQDVVHSDTFAVASVGFERIFDLSRWPNGKYTLRAQLLVNDKAVAESRIVFPKMPFKSNEVKLDRFRRCMLIGGKPFLALGFFWESSDITAEVIEHLASCNINFMQIYQPDVLVSRKEIVKAAERCGMYFQIYVDGRTGMQNKRIPEFRDSPVVASWYPFGERFTEPSGQQNPGSVYDVIEECRQLDPYHPVVSLENGPGMDYVLAKKLPFPGDIPMVDYYVYPPQSHVQNIDVYAKAVMRMGELEGLPGFMGPFSSGYAFHASRDPLPKEHEFTFYCCLINGIRGFLYWADYPKSATSFRKLVELFGEARQLNDVLFSEEAVPVVSCDQPKIIFTLKSLNGELYLLAVNSANSPIDATFTIPSGKSRVDVLFENRDISLTNQLMKDNFAPLSRHVYRIRK